MKVEGAQERTYSRGGSLLAHTRRLLRQFDLRAKKSLAQHFLIDGRILGRIVAAAEITPDDTVVEVGPGLGVLTEELARRAGRVVAVELDSKLSAILQERMASCQNVVVINRDILEVEPASLLESVSLPASGTSTYKVVANLPYYITSAVLRHFLEARAKPRIMVVTVQREVARAIVARPGEMSLLSVSVQFYGRPRIVSRVPARCFYPAPEVDSAILRVDLYPQLPWSVSDEASFFALARAGFAAPRKQIANSLSQGLRLPKAEVLALLDKGGIVPQRRAETLTVDEWARLWQASIQVAGATC